MRDDRGQVRISAIIPAFNAEPWLGEAVRSVHAQTSPVFEIIVVNDGSADEIPGIGRADIETRQDALQNLAQKIAGFET
jgi:glycosyltransferase involved in cell wall biosynthesis